MALVPFPGPQSVARPLPPEDDDPSSSGKMTFLEHLDELRKRIVYACYGIGLGIVAGFFFIDRIFNFIMAPTVKALPAGSTLIYTQPGEAFSLYITVSLLTGAVVAAPWIMYQVWMFIAPGLYANERRMVIPFVIFSSGFFVLGAAFNHWVAFPFMMTFFAGFNTLNLRFMPRLEDVLGLYAKMLIGIGLIFEMPTVILFLAKMRMVTARFLLVNFKYALLLIFVAAAVITPTGDPMTQLIFAAPMVGLYGLSIIVAWVFSPRRLRDSEPAA